MKSKLYRCFSTNLKQYLLDKGHRYELIARDVVSRDKMWIFIQSNELENDIHEWELRSPKQGA